MKTSFTIQAHPFHLVEPSPCIKNLILDLKNLYLYKRTFLFLPIQVFHQKLLKT